MQFLKALLCTNWGSDMSIWSTEFSAKLRRLEEVDHIVRSDRFYDGMEDNMLPFACLSAY